MSTQTLEKRTVSRFNDPKYRGEFALYKGDEMIMIGTIPEIAAFKGVHVDSIQYYLTDAYARKIEKRGTPRPTAIVPLDDGEDEF